MQIDGTTHEFIKQNLSTIIRGKKVYDKVKCKLCGLEGIRYSLSNIVNVKYDKKCPKKASKKVQIISRYVCNNFGFEYGKIYERCECPDKYKEIHKDAIWIYSDERKEPVRLLSGEFNLLND